MGTPISINAADFVLGFLPTRVKNLSQEECIRVVQAILQRCKPYLQNLVLKTFSEISEKSWVTLPPSFPNDFDAKTRCVSILYRGYEGKDIELLLTSKGQLFIWTLQWRFDSKLRRSVATHNLVDPVNEGILQSFFGHPIATANSIIWRLSSLFEETISRREFHLRGMRVMKEYLDDVSGRLGSKAC